MTNGASTSIDQSATDSFVDSATATSETNALASATATGSGPSSSLIPTSITTFNSASSKATPADDSTATREEVKTSKTSTSISEKPVIEVPTSVDFSRLVATSTDSVSQATGIVYPQVIVNPLSSICSQCLTFQIRILAPYENLFGSNNFLASQAFNAIPDLVAEALSTNPNRITASMIFANADAVATLNNRALGTDVPHYYISMSIIKDNGQVNPITDLQSLGTTLSSQVRDSSSPLHTINQWGALIDRSYLKITSRLEELKGVAQTAPNSPNQVDSPFKGTVKSNSRKMWIGIGIAIAIAIMAVIVVWYVRRQRRALLKENFWVTT
ncbi:hypothetical protein GGF37_005593 [Kickxella alabastrina]|nr:hypothetical protein GGF37_005593 [Kickxella alabastrina]